MSKTIVKSSLLYLLLFLVVAIAVQGTIAHFKLIYSKKNEVILGTIIPEIVENNDLNNAIRENIRIKNIGNSPMYIRVSLIYYFENENGSIIKDEPLIDSDYTLEYSTSSNWIKSSEEYYYYKLILYPDEETDNLIETLEEIDKEDSKIFKMDMAVQAIQANPSRAVIEAWNVSIEDNKIVVQ